MLSKKDTKKMYLSWCTHTEGTSIDLRLYLCGLQKRKCQESEEPLLLFGT